MNTEVQESAPTPPEREPERGTRERSRGADRLLMIAILVLQFVVLGAFGAFYIQGRRQHEILGTRPDANATPPTQGALVLPSDPLLPSPGVASSSDPSARFSQMERQMARLHQDMLRRMQDLGPEQPDVGGFPPQPGFEGDLDSHIQAMMESAFQQFRALENSAHFDEGWTSLMRSPALDMQDAGDRYVVICSLPGLDEADVKVTLEGRLLTILGQTSSRARQPLQTTRFERRLLLPGPVADNDQAKASMENGLLRVEVPKSDHMAPVTKPKSLL